LPDDDEDHAVTRANLAATTRKAALLAAAIIACGALPALAEVQVVLDQAKIIRMPSRMATIVIGNPSIADVTVQKNGIAIITGKTYGVTNLIVLDPAGEMLSEEQVVVKPAESQIVTVQRGVDRESLACTPLCERTVKLGDAAANFDAITGQASARSGLATNAPSK
jgi:Flp pilus assembly secretin CpaC